MNKFLENAAAFLRETDKLLLFLRIAASTYGCVIVYSATRINGGYRQILMQGGCMIAGVVAALVISAVDYRKIVKFWPLIAGVSVLLVVLTFFIGYAPSGTDDKAWLSFGAFSFQPAELLKIAFAITFPLHLVKTKDVNKPLSLLLLILHGAFPVLLIHFQGDDGTAIIFAVMFVAMLFAAGLKVRYIAIGAGAVAAMLPVAWFFVLNEAQRDRFISLLNPEDDLLGSGWQQWRGRIALANGGIFGQGYLHGPNVQSGTIPEGYNDFIFASLGEEFGLIGCVVAMLLLAGICFKILSDSRKTKDKLGSLLCIGLFAMFASNMLVNIGMVLSLLPVVGVTLPFFSAGGTNLACLFLGIGLVLSVYRHREADSLYIR